MSARRRIVLLGFCLLLVCFCLGLYRLMALRFDAGDVFPPYSTLRSDPLGSKVFYRSLERLEGVTVQRHYRKLKDLEGTEPSTIFFLGLSPEELQILPDTIHGLLAKGHRIVLSLHPVRGRAGADEENPAESCQPDGDGVVPDRKPIEEKGLARLGVRLEFAPLFDDGEAGKAEAFLTADGYRSDFPEHIPVHSKVRFTGIERDWRILYRVEGEAVLMERHENGGGSLVLVADSYLFSNEAMLRDRHAAILAWIAGKGPFVFDETHHGLRRQPGVMLLLRQYRLAPFLGVLLVLAALFVWKRSVPFAPRLAAVKTDDDEASAMDYHAGLTNLLRRNLTDRNLLATCVDEWQRSLGRQHLSETEKDRIRSVVESGNTSPNRGQGAVEGYKKIAAILKERKRSWK
jgi:hypothetical protein